ncbi:Ig-like domain-containing protein [Dyadobacter luticola]|uniref:Ig-like domain-containing protein n=1 Tax=Dyadobacter luticola TaxID=1979387 RepID=UPI0035B65004
METAGSPLPAAPKPSSAVAGTKSYWVSQIVNGCESERSEIVVTISACTPPAAPAVSDVNKKIGDPEFTLNATGENLKWYTSATGGDGTTVKPKPSTATAGTTSYFVTQTVGGCESPRAEIKVIVAACTPPDPPKVANVSYTLNAPTKALEADGINLKWYTSSSDVTGSATSPKPSSGTIGVTSYFVTQSSASGCESARAEIKVTVTACTPPDAPTVADVSYCFGKTVTPLTATGIGLKWYNANGDLLGSAPTPSTNAAGTVSYFVTQTVGACTSSKAEIKVTVNQTSPPAVDNIDYCLNATAPTLTATGTSLLWYTASSGGTGSASAPTPTTNSLGTKSYFVSQTVNGCESARSELKVTVKNLSALPTVTSPVSICQNSDATALTVTATSPKWYTTATGGTALGAAPIPVTTTAGTTSYYVSQTAATLCEGPRAKIDVVVNATPAAPTVKALDYCVGIKADPLTPSGTTYKWYAALTGGTGTGTAPIPLTTTAGVTSFYVTQLSAYGSLSCESPRAKLDVTVNPTPANLAALSEAYCQTRGDSTYTFPTKAADGNTLNWYTAASGGTGSATTPTVNAKTAGEATFYVTQKSAKNCESPARVAQKVRIKKLPNVPTIEKPSIEYCQFIKVDPLTATPVTNATLNWYDSQTGGSGSNTAPTPSTAEGGTKSYFVAQTLEGCTSDRAKIDVKINTTPVPDTKTSLAYCQNEVAPRLEATGNVLKWYRSADATEFQGVPFTPFTEKVQDYSFFVTQTGATNGCESPKEEIKIHIKSLPSATITGNSTIDLGSTANINIKFTGDGPWIYALSNGLTDTTDQSNHQVEVKPSTTTTYVVTEVSNACGKGLPIGSALVTVKVPTINSGNPSVAEVCAGKTFSVPFQQSGDFPSENTFKVQIAANNEDAQFRTIPSTATNNIVTATFPDTTKGGSYFVRVISSGANAEFTVKGSVSAITITASPLPIATLTGTQTILVGESANLKAEITGRSPWTLTLNNGTKDTLITASVTPYTFRVTPKTTSTYTITRVTNGCGIGNGVGSARVQVDPILGVEPSKSADWVKVYPTMIQANCIVEITGTLVPKQASVEVVDLSGRSRAINVIREKTTEINFSSYPSGLYLLRIKNGDQSTVQRVMKP